MINRAVSPITSVRHTHQTFPPLVATELCITGSGYHTHTSDVMLAGLAYVSIATIRNTTARIAAFTPQACKSWDDILFHGMNSSFMG